MTVRLNFPILAAAAYVLRVGLAVLVAWTLVALLPGEAAPVRIPALGVSACDHGQPAALVAPAHAVAPDLDEAAAPTPWLPVPAARPSSVLRPGRDPACAEGIACCVERPPRA